MRELAINNNSGKKITEVSIDKQREYINSVPPWVDSARSTIGKKSQNKLSVWQRAAKMLAQLPYNKIKKKQRKSFGFTCPECPKRGNKLMWEMRAEVLGGNDRSTFLSEGTRIKQALPIRCSECNRKHQRYKRARRAMQKIHDRNMDIWFITLTKPNITGVPGDSPFIQEIDREEWVADFKRFRRTKIWKGTFAGGYWFYEYTSHKPGDKIFAKDGTFIRQAQDHEINGHLHILATADGRIPMKEIAHQWGHRVDFKQPKEPNDVLRYLRGYLTKCELKGMNMRPFGDIHRSDTTV